MRLGRGFQFEYVSLDDHRVITLHMTWTMLGTFLLTGTCCLLAGLWKRYVHPRLAAAQSSCAVSVILVPAGACDHFGKKFNQTLCATPGFALHGKPA